MNKVFVNKDASIKLLCCAVIMQAVKDLKYGSIRESLDALMWLTGDEFEYWKDCAELPINPYKLLVKGTDRI